MSGPERPIARIDNLTLRYGKTFALDAVTLCIPSGCMAGLIGPDGVGKSSLLAVIGGARRIQTGQVHVLDGDHPDEVLVRLALVGHRAALQPDRPRLRHLLAAEPHLLALTCGGFRYHSAGFRAPFDMSTIIQDIERRQLREVPQFKAGDTVRVHFRVIEGTRSRIQVFEGIVIKRQGAGARETFTVRKNSFGVGVERTFPLHSPKIDKIEVGAIGDVNRAKLYYLRGKVGKKARVRELRSS